MTPLANFSGKYIKFIIYPSIKQTALKVFKMFVFSRANIKPCISVISNLLKIPKCFNPIRHPQRFTGIPKIPDTAIYYRIAGIPCNFGYNVENNASILNTGDLRRKEMYVRFDCDIIEINRAL